MIIKKLGGENRAKVFLQEGQSEDQYNGELKKYIVEAEGTNLFPISTQTHRFTWRSLNKRLGRGQFISKNRKNRLSRMNDRNLIRRYDKNRIKYVLRKRRKRRQQKLTRPAKRFRNIKKQRKFRKTSWQKGRRRSRQGE